MYSILRVVRAMLCVHSEARGAFQLGAGPSRCFTHPMPLHKGCGQLITIPFAFVPTIGVKGLIKPAGHVSGDVPFVNQ
jgi:hypothetical protein